ncbi:MAG TPA: fatty acid desaturase [bacterium]|nr:fatty acid desaturase [bacterium]
MKLLRHAKDWISLTHVGLTLVALVAFYQLASHPELRFPGWWALGLLAVLAGIYTNYVAHNHSHRGISDIRWVNRTLDFVLGFTSGTPLVFWRLHHVQNHHRYEGTKDDWSWNYGYEGCQFPEKPIGLLYYSLTFNLIVFCQVTLYILRRPFSKDFHDYWVTLLVLGIANVFLLAWNPWAWLVTNGLIYVSAPFFLGFANYFHHYGCVERRGVKASNNFINHWSNQLSYNIGFHIEHSMKPTMHWSELPTFYRAHRDEIPPEHIATRFFPGAGSMPAAHRWLKHRASFVGGVATEAREAAAERLGGVRGVAAGTIEGVREAAAVRIEGAREAASQRLEGAREAASLRIEGVREVAAEKLEVAAERLGEVRDVAADVLQEAKRAATPPQIAGDKVL